MMPAAVALTDTGQIRERNEDSFLLDNGASLFAVADGMGGHAAGDVASQTAIAAFAAAFAETRSVVIAMKAANRAVIERGNADPARAGMGTTLTAVHITGDAALVAHVGDSRLYRLRAGRLEQLTRDHTVADEMIERGTLTRIEAMLHPANSMLTRSLGSRADVAVDELQEKLQTGDVLMLCSDGLTSMVTDADIAAVLQQQAKSLDRKAAELIEAATLRGGVDNITVVLITV
ncbi:MAG TPA: Stp1/IreP family PP2C-type Ser/Thr phosphatase [Longimicrobiales bacterium]